MFEEWEHMPNKYSMRERQYSVWDHNSSSQVCDVEPENIRA